MPEYSEEVLLEDFHRGNHKAFEEIYNMFFSRLYAFALSLINSEPEAEEIVLDVMVIVLKKHKDFKTVKNIRAFLYISTRNACFSYLRAKKRRKIKTVELDSTLQADGSLEIRLLEGELLTVIYTAIKTLPDKCKTIMEMLYLEELDVNAISEKLNISVQTVYSQKSRAISILKDALAKNIPVLFSLLII